MLNVERRGTPEIGMCVGWRQVGVVRRRRCGRRHCHCSRRRRVRVGRRRRARRGRASLLLLLLLLRRSPRDLALAYPYFTCNQRD